MHLMPDIIDNLYIFSIFYIIYFIFSLRYLIGYFLYSQGLDFAATRNGSLAQCLLQSAVDNIDLSIFSSSLFLPQY